MIKVVYSLTNKNWIFTTCDKSRVAFLTIWLDFWQLFQEKTSWKVYAQWLDRLSFFLKQTFFKAAACQQVLHTTCWPIKQHMQSKHQLSLSLGLLSYDKIYHIRRSLIFWRFLLHNSNFNTQLVDFNETFEAWLSCCSGRCAMIWMPPRRQWKIWTTWCTNYRTEGSAIMLDQVRESKGNS